MKAAWMIPDRPKPKHTLSKFQIIMYFVGIINCSIAAYYSGHNNGFKKGEAMGKIEERLGWQRAFDSAAVLVDTLYKKATRPTRVEIDICTHDTTRYYDTDTTRMMHLPSHFFDTVDLNVYEQTQDTGIDHYKLNL